MEIEESELVDSIIGVLDLTPELRKRITVVLDAHMKLKKEPRNPDLSKKYSNALTRYYVTLAKMQSRSENVIHPREIIDYMLYNDVEINESTATAIVLLFAKLISDQGYKVVFSYNKEDGDFSCIKQAIKDLEKQNEIKIENEKLSLIEKGRIAVEQRINRLIYRKGRFVQLVASSVEICKKCVMEHSDELRRISTDLNTEYQNYLAFNGKNPDPKNVAIKKLKTILDNAVNKKTGKEQLQDQEIHGVVLWTMIH